MTPLGFILKLVDLMFQSFGYEPMKVSPEIVLHTNLNIYLFIQLCDCTSFVQWHMLAMTELPPVAQIIKE